MLTPARRTKEQVALSLSLPLQAPLDHAEATAAYEHNTIIATLLLQRAKDATSFLR